MPPPLRSKTFPYGLPGLSHQQKDDCNMGTILMARAVGMVDTIHRAARCTKVPSFATLENPPPSEHEEHISAWHMPEMVELVDKIEEWQCAHFHTCAYQSELEPGTNALQTTDGGRHPSRDRDSEPEVQLWQSATRTHNREGPLQEVGSLPVGLLQGLRGAGSKALPEHGQSRVPGGQTGDLGGQDQLPQVQHHRRHERGREHRERNLQGRRVL